MSIEIRAKCGDVLRVVEADTLCGADLRCANLYGANLSHAHLHDADMRGADLHGADLRDSNLHGADLRCADLRGANLRGANLRGADMRGATLHGADMRGATLRYATLRGADMRDSNLHDADLHDADLHDANLMGAKNIHHLVFSNTTIVPESGPFFGWKKCNRGVLVQVAVGEDAKRSNATGRKCRAEYVKVLQVIGAEVGISKHDNNTLYKVGEVVHCDKWEEDRWQECAGGIHFFLTRAEAEAY